MSTLATAAPIGATQLALDTPLTGVGSGQFAIKVDSELLFVGGVQYKDGLTLALKFPTTTIHAQGATVTPVLDAFTTSASSPFASGGAEVTPAAHVDPPTATPQQIAEALIAAGLMEAS